MMQTGLAGSYLCSFNLFEIDNVFLHDKLEEQQDECGEKCQRLSSVCKMQNSLL